MTRGVDLRLEAVRIEPGRVAVLELVAEEPEVPAGLEVVAGRRLLRVRAVLRGEEVRVDVLQRRPRRDERGRDVERGR